MTRADVATRFAPGHASTGGRPKGARSRLGDQFLERLRDDFDKHGLAVIQHVRENDTTAYFTTIAKLLPKELTATLQVQQRVPEALTPAEWERIIAALRIPRDLGADGTPDQIAERIERALYLEFSRPMIEALLPPAL